MGSYNASCFDAAFFQGVVERMSGAEFSDRADSYTPTNGWN